MGGDPARITVIAVAVMLSGCSSTGTSQSVRACNDYLDAFTDIFAGDCEGGTYDKAAAEALDRVGVDSCDEVDRVRNANEFYNRCLPDIVNMTCAEITGSSRLPPTCENQLIDDESDG